mgnify:CR=1 FL=1
MEKINECSLNLERKNIEKLRSLFPEAVQEGVVNYDILKSILGSEIFGGGGKSITNLLGMVNTNL